MRRGITALLSTGAALALLASCGTYGGEPTSAPATSATTASQEPTANAPTSDTPSDGPTDDGGRSFPEGTEPQTAKNHGDWDLVLTDVRVAEHEGYDRTVLEFTGTGSPGWAVNYVDKAVLDGSGKIVRLAGDAILDIYASGTTYPASASDGYSGPTQFGPEHGGNLADVYVGGTFEGYTQVLAGIDGDPVPFRVFALADPPRLVVDIVRR